MKRKHVFPRAVTIFLLGLLMALPLHAGEGPAIVRMVETASLNQAPDTLSFYLYDAPDAAEPIRIEHLQADRWQADVDLQPWPPAQERAIRFRAELGGLDAIATDAPLWVEMEVDGVAVGERSVLTQAAAGAGGISTAGMVESRSGGFKFPDGSIQTSAASGTGSGGNGTVTSVTAGSGLSGGTITTTGTISVDPSQTQSRVSGSCPAGSSIRAIAVDGTVSCENDDVGSGGGGGGTVTSITAGSGLTGGTITGAGTIGVDTSQIQARVGGMCPVGSSIRTISASGSVVCESDDVGATTSDLAAHAATASAHHSRYANSEAVTAIKAVDGAGSSLDADLLDGLHASEVIASAVAQSAVAIPISSLPYTINQPGAYYVTASLDGSGGGITIQASDVTLDLMGFTLDGYQAGNWGIYFDGIRRNITVKNGTVKRFSLYGLYAQSTSSKNLKVVNMDFIDNGWGTTTGGGITFYGANVLVAGCVVYGSSGSGVVVGVDSTLRNNLISSNSKHGIYGGTLIEGNMVINNGAAGSQYAGISVPSGSGASIIHNVVKDNHYNGIYSASNSLIQDNVVTGNNQGDDVARGGIRGGSRNRVIGNILGNNKQNGILMTSSGNVFIDNHITSTNPGNGIKFPVYPNFYRDNTAYGNGTDFATTAATVDGGGNVGF